MKITLFILTIISQELSPLYTPDADLIENNYIIMLKNGISTLKMDAHLSLVNQFISMNKNTIAYSNDSSDSSDSDSDSDDDVEDSINHIYKYDGLNGYSGKFSNSLLNKIRALPEVDFIEQDTMVSIDKKKKTGNIKKQKDAPWGLARISHRKKLGSKSMHKYKYDKVGGENVTVYVIDTGVNIDHVEFEGRAKWGATIPKNDMDIDGNGHGTHCAGTIGSKKYGVAKKANIIAVKVLRSNGAGTMSDVIRGIQWAALDSKKKKIEAEKKKKSHKGSVGNMSLGGGYSRALNMAVNSAVKGGFHFAVAAGNDNEDACDYSPASAEEAVSVGASNIRDMRAWFSNVGKCVDLFAPGQDILSTWIGNKHATNTISGTSMASPHIAGLMAYYLSVQPSKFDLEFTGELKPKQLKELMIKHATKDILDGVPKDTPNLLAFNA